MTSPCTSTRKDYDAFLAKVAAQTGLDALVPDAGGLVAYKVDDAYVLNLQYVEHSSKILCFVELATLPKSAGKDVYRELLVGSLFGRETAGGFFAVEPETETVVYHYLFDFDAATADAGEFVETLEKILSLVDIWAGKIADALDAPSAPESAPANDAGDGLAGRGPNGLIQV